MADRTLSRVVTNARILETVENYARVEVGDNHHPHWAGRRDFGNDETFWSEVLAGRVPFGTSIDFPQGAAVSEWVARVPGLFWTKTATKLRKFTNEHVERRESGSVVLRPIGKSRVVSGGVGTMRLPPNRSGDRLVTLATSGNVSAGIPALVTNDVWRGRRLKEGAVIAFRGASWQAMDESWASRFPSTRGVPRGYLRINVIPATDYGGDGAATEIHPFTVMEYASGNTLLFDFVFATAITGDPGYRADVEEFFDHYKTDEGRNGRYLLAADVAEPLWDSEFTSPEQLRSSAPSAASHLHVLQRRIEDSMGGTDTTDYLLRILTRTDLGILRRLSADIGVPHSLWFRGGSVADESAHLIEHVTPEKIPILIDAVSTINPDYLDM